MRLHSSLLLVLPGISLAAEVGSQSYETLESSTTYQDAQESTAAVTESMDAEGFGLPHTEEGYAEHVNAEGDESDRPDWRKKLRNRGQCDTTTSNTFTVSGSSEEQLGETEKVAEGEEYESQGYGHGDGKAAHYTGTEIFGFPPPAVPHDPTRRRIYPIPPTPQNPQSGMRRYLATEDADAEAYEEEQTTEPAASRELGKKKKVTYVAEPVKMAPAPIMMAAPTKKAPPMIIEAAPVKKGRYLAAEDETEVQFETEQFETETEQYDSATERGLGKKKKVTYVSQPMKVAPPPQKYVAPTKAPAPIVMAAPTKKAAPVIIEAAPTKKGRYLAAEDETEMHFETEQFEAEQHESATERGLGKKKKKAVYVSQPVKMAPPPVVMAAPTKKAAPMVVQAAPTKVAPAPRVVQAAPTKAPAPMIIESAPTKMAPAPMVIESAPTKMAHAPMVIESAPTKMAPAPMVVEAAHTKMDHAPMVIEAAPHMKGRYLAAEDEVEMQFEAEQFESETVQHATAAERGLGKKKKVAYVSQPMKVAPPPQKYVAPTKAPAPIVMAAPTKKAAPVIIEAAPTKKGRYLAAEDETEMHFEAEQFEAEQHESATERGLGKKKKKAAYVSQPVKMAPPPVVMAAPTKKAAPMVVQAAPTKVAPAPRVVQAAPTKAPPPMIIESAPTKMAPAPMVIESAPTKMAHAPMVIESAPTKMAPAPMVIEAAPHMKGRYLAAEYVDAEMH